MAEDQDVDQSTPEQRQEATEIGWVDKDKFRGDPDRWVDAATYLARGRDVLPLLRKNNERLRGELQQTRTKLAELEASVAAGTESVEELKKFHKEVLQTKVKEARAQLLAEIREARDSDDPEALPKALGELSQFDAEQAVAARAAPARKGNGADTVEGGGTRRAPVEPEPWFKQWLADNSWFGKDRKKTIAANVIAEQLRTDPAYKDLKGPQFMEKLDEELAIEMGEDTGRVESGGRGPARGNGQSFDDLPKDAKDTARRQVGKMVGTGKAFKTEKDWFKYYAETYYS